MQTNEDVKKLMAEATKREGSQAENPVQRLMEDLTSASVSAKANSEKVADLRAKGTRAVAVIAVSPLTYLSIGLISLDVQHGEDPAAGTESFNHFIADIQRGRNMPGSVMWNDVPVVISTHVLYMASAIIDLTPEADEEYTALSREHAAKKLQQEFGVAEGHA